MTIDLEKKLENRYMSALTEQARAIDRGLEETKEGARKDLK